MTPSSSRDHVLILDFAARFSSRADELLRHSGYAVLKPRSGSEAVESFEVYRDRIAFILAASKHWKLASSMQCVESDIRVFVFDGAEKTRVAVPQGMRGRKPWLSSLGTFP